MARMHPEDIEAYEEATEGERKVFRFVREAARPHKDFMCWYQPQIGPSGRWADRIFFRRKLGRPMLEIRDLAFRQINSYKATEIAA